MTHQFDESKRIEGDSQPIGKAPYASLSSEPASGGETSVETAPSGSSPEGVLRPESEQPTEGCGQPFEATTSDTHRARAVPSAMAYPLQLATSTLLSLLMVTGLLLLARFLVPPLVENVRYGWHRGQLRAQYELSGEQLSRISLESLSDVSNLVSQRAGPSVVHINLLRNQRTLNRLEGLLGRSNPNVRYEGQGSGFVVDAEGHIVTNHHVVEGMGQIEVTFSDGRQLGARVIGVDPATDLAVLKVDVTGLMPAEWGDSERMEIGSPVWALGSAFGLQQTVTFGIISGKHRVDFRGTRYEQRVIGGTAYGDLMQSDVALNPGNSGGPLVNSRGQVVGVNAAILGETYSGVSFSIPSRVAKRVVQNLIDSGEVQRGWLGIRMEDLAIEDRYRTDGSVVAGVRVTGFPNLGPSPARDAGIKVGDLVVEFNEQQVVNQLELMRMIGEAPVGQAATVVVQRDGQEMAFNVVIGRRDIALSNK